MMKTIPQLRRNQFGRVCSAVLSLFPLQVTFDELALMLHTEPPVVLVAGLDVVGVNVGAERIAVTVHLHCGECIPVD